MHGPCGSSRQLTLPTAHDRSLYAPDSNFVKGFAGKRHDEFDRRNYVAHLGSEKRSMRDLILQQRAQALPHRGRAIELELRA